MKYMPFFTALALIINCLYAFEIQIKESNEWILYDTAPLKNLHNSPSIKYLEYSESKEFRIEAVIMQHSDVDSNKSLKFKREDFYAGFANSQKQKGFVVGEKKPILLNGVPSFYIEVDERNGDSNITIVSTFKKYTYIIKLFKYNQKIALKYESEGVRDFLKRVTFEGSKESNRK